MGFVLLYSMFWLFDNRFMLPIGFSHSSFVFLLTSLTIVQMSFATNAPRLALVSSDKIFFLIIHLIIH